MSIEEKKRDIKELEKVIEEKLTRLEKALGIHLENHEKGIAHTPKERIDFE